MKEEEDGISSLPDCLLIDIISRLPETKEAIRTSKLSKRWKTLWTEVHNLTFVYSDPEYIDKTLTQCSSQSNLDSFRLRTRVFYKCKWKINNWILYANNRNVQELELFFCDDWLKPKLHQFFFTNSCFTHLKLEGCLLNPTGAISWNKLKSFYISGMELDEDLIQNILSGSPLLETLELRNCYGFRRIDITSKSVKNLVFFADSGYGGGCRMKINAPHIQSLTLKIYVSWCKFLLHDVSTLVKAKLDYCKAKSRLGCWSAGQYQKIIDKEEEEQEQVLKGFMLSLRHVKELIMIGKQCIQVLSRLEAKGFVFPSGLRLQDDSDRFRGN